MPLENPGRLLFLTIHKSEDMHIMVDILAMNKSMKNANTGIGLSNALFCGEKEHSFCKLFQAKHAKFKKGVEHEHSQERM